MTVELAQQVDELQARSVYPASETAHQELVHSLQRSLQEAVTAVDQLKSSSR